MKISMTQRAEKVLSIALSALFGAFIINRLLAWNGWLDMLMTAFLFILCLILLVRTFGWYEISDKGVSECTWISRKRFLWSDLAYTAEEEDTYRGLPLKRFVFSKLPKAQRKRRFLTLPNRRVICISFILAAEMGTVLCERTESAVRRYCPAQLFTDGQR